MNAVNSVTSKDGTQIAFETKGSGAPVILVDGALCYRSFGPMGALSELLAPHFTVFTYDRRGRGFSTNGKPYTLAREIEDMEALIQQAGGSAYVYGISSGACLALEAALALGKQVSKLAMYEPPYNDNGAARVQWKEYTQQLTHALAEGRRGDAVVLFMELVGTPSDQISGMKQAPVWQMFEMVAPTLAYDAAAMGSTRGAPLERAAQLGIPALVMDGGANLAMMPFMHETAAALAQAIPNAQHCTLEGQTHDVNLQVLAPVLIDFFGGQG
jgi:pimeloyl-ACP methyl ester carboxylesterase